MSSETDVLAGGAPTDSANLLNTNKEQFMSTDQKNVPAGGAPTDSANPLNTNKEQSMSTDQKNVPAGGAPTDSAGTKTSPGKRRGHGKKYDPSALEREAEALKAKVAGLDDPLVMEDVGNVDAGLSLIRPAAASVAGAINGVAAARAAFGPAEANLAQKIAPVAGVLKATPGGRRFYASCKGRHPEITAQNIVEGLAASGLGVPSELIRDLRDASAVAAPMRKKLDETETAKASAVEQYSTARDELKSSISMLRATKRRYAAARKQGKTERKRSAKHRSGSAPSPTPPVPTLAGGLNGLSNGAPLPA